MNTQTMKAQAKQSIANMRQYTPLSAVQKAVIDYHEKVIELIQENQELAQGAPLIMHNSLITDKEKIFCMRDKKMEALKAENEIMRKALKKSAKLACKCHPSVEVKGNCASCTAKEALGTEHPIIQLHNIGAHIAGWEIYKAASGVNNYEAQRVMVRNSVLLNGEPLEDRNYTADELNGATLKFGESYYKLEAAE